MNIMVIGQIYETTDYQMFKRLEGNREVTAKRAEKIKRNIEEHGYILNPIVVNEQYQIIDGQGRVEALSQLGLPVHYVIARGTGVKECAALNSASTSWRLIDYIYGFADRGDENYVRLKKLFDNNDDFTINERCTIITGQSHKMATDAIKNGRFKFTVSMYEESEADFSTIRQFKPDLKRVNGTTEHYINAILFAIKAGVDKKRIKKVLSEATLPPAPTRKCALDYLSDAYNKGLMINRKIYLYPLYEESMIKKYGWYGSRLEKNGGKGWRNQG